MDWKWIWFYGPSAALLIVAVVNYFLNREGRDK